MKLPKNQRKRARGRQKKNHIEKLKKKLKGRLEKSL